MPLGRATVLMASADDSRVWADEVGRVVDALTGPCRLDEANALLGALAECSGAHRPPPDGQAAGWHDSVHRRLEPVQLGTTGCGGPQTGGW
jgi:hypothetical protein